MAQMRPAPPAKNLRPIHALGFIRAGIDAALVSRRAETGPSGPGIEFGSRVEDFPAAANALIRALILPTMVSAAERLLSFLTPGYKVLVDSQYLPPLSIRHSGVIHVPILEIMIFFHNITPFCNTHGPLRLASTTLVENIYKHRNPSSLESTLPLNIIHTYFKNEIQTGM
jgi:hypothetical protein